jgi:hypothetical protein
MVNIQDEAEFDSHRLNRDTWGNETVLRRGLVIRSEEKAFRGEWGYVGISGLG